MFPPCSQLPGTYSVSAEKSSPFKGKFWMVFAVNVPLKVGFSVFRIGASDSFTVTVCAWLPTVSFTLNFTVWSISSANAGTVCAVNPVALTVSSYCPMGKNRMLYTPA
jgi:hypothetical protein